MTNVGAVEVMVLLVIALAVVLWMLRSTPKQGQKVLQRWGIVTPTEEQGRIAADYLKRRRNLYPFVAVVVFGLGVLGERLFSADGGLRWDGLLLFALITSLLVAELIATMRRPHDRTRSATLTPRRFTDIVPRYGLLALGFLVLLTVTATVATIAALPFVEARNAWRLRHLEPLQKVGDWDALAVDTDLGPVGFSLLAFMICVILSLSVVRLCQARGPLTSDLAVDAALRIRSGRVAVGTAILLGIGFVGSVNGAWIELARTAVPGPGLPGQLTADHPPVPGWIMPLDRVITWSTLAGFLLCLFVWGVLVSPWRTQRLVAARA